MSSGTCAPDYGNSNPCFQADPALIREQGRPGSPGIPGGTPAFVVGTVATGPNPSVTYTMVNPLLYRVDYIIPSTNVNQPNTWTATQTFTDIIVSGNASVLGTTTLTVLDVSGTATFAGLTVFNGATTFNSSADFAAGITTTTLTASGLVTLNGIVKIPNIVQLPAATAIQGAVVVQPDGTLNFVVANTGANVVAGSSALAAVVAWNSAEVAIAFSQNFVVPAGPDARVSVVAQVTLQPNGANPPANLSGFIIRARLDDVVIGTVVTANGVTNFEASCNLLGDFTAPAGAHTVFYTIQGLGTGGSSINLTSISGTIKF